MLKASDRMNEPQPSSPHDSAPCNQCYALERAPTKTEPHGSLELTASVHLPSGSREEYVCTVCRQRMLRFMANQVSPPPSDVWRFASSGAAQATIFENVLSRIPAHYIAETLQTLPDAASPMKARSWKPSLMCRDWAVFASRRAG